MTTYKSAIDTVRSLKAKYGNTWNSISPENAARMTVQNRFKTGLDIYRIFSHFKVIFILFKLRRHYQTSLCNLAVCKVCICVPMVKNITF